MKKSALFADKYSNQNMHKFRISNPKGFEMKFYQKAHDLLMNYIIISSESLPQKFSDLQLVVEKLASNSEHISNWENNGKIIYEFLKLRSDSIGYFTTFFDKYDEFKYTEEDWKNFKSGEDIIRLQKRLSTLIKSFENF